MPHRLRIRPLLLLGPVSLAVILAAAGAQAAEPPKPPPVPANLFANSDFETDADRDGLPDGWYRSDPQYWCGPREESDRWKELRELWVKKGAVPDRIPFRHPDTLEGGTYRWEAPGSRSGHAISIDETTDLKWGEWDTVVKGIKPNTSYVIMGRRRQSVPARRRPGPPGWLKIAAFGRMIPVRGTVHRDAWVPFAVAVNSGAFKGECRVGFIVAAAPTKVWIDRGAMFEGTPADIPRFRLGPKGAALDYSFHPAAYGSPDVQCPFFFDIAWSFRGGNGGPGLEVVVDLPDGLDLTWSERGMAITLEARDPERITIEGRPYVRRAFAISSAKEVGDFDSAGKRAIRLWLKADAALAGRTFEAYYHARWRGGRQPDQPLRVQVVRIGEVPRAKALFVAVAGPPAKLVNARASILVKDLARLGVDCLLLDASLDPEVTKAFEEAGIAPAVSFDLGRTVPEEGAARDRAGKVLAGHVCPTYRPEDALKTLFAEPARLVEGGTTTLVIDLRNGGATACFCPRCVAAFKAFVSEEKPTVEYVAPATFEADRKRHKELHALWREFHAVKLADLYWTLRKQLDGLRRKDGQPLANTSPPLRLLAWMRPPPAADEPEAGVVYTRLAGAFDIEIIEPHVLLAEPGGTSARVGAETGRLARLLPPGGRAGVAIDAGSSHDRNRVTPVIRHADVRDQVLEAVAAGAKAVVLRPFYAIDGMDLKQFAGAVALLRPFEDLIAEGEALDVVKPVGEAARVRCLGKKGRMLVLVANGTAPAAVVKLTLDLPKESIAKDLVLVDVEAGSVVSKIDPDTKEVTVPVGAGPRLFYLGPQRDMPKDAGETD